MRTLLLALLLSSSTFTLVSAQVTYADDIADIIYQNCATCHRPGEIGPFTLTSYNEVRSWGSMIKFVTSERLMPPWQPEPHYASYLGENFLSDEQIADIAEWVDNGMPRGDESAEPAFPDFPEGSVLGEPDLVLTMEEAWMHEGNNRDDYRYFVFPVDIPEDKVIKTIEFRPGNSRIVHHALIFEDRTGQAAQNDAATPEYGFDGFGSFTNRQDPTGILNQKQYPGFVPGQKPIFSPDGTGWTLHKDADIVVQVHYAPWPVDEWDQSSFNIFFMDEDEEVFEREIKDHIMVPFQEVINDIFAIPANSVREFHGTYTVPFDVSLINISPHMHLLGQHWEVWMERPDGERVNLVHIPKWDFNWQGAYHFDRYIYAPRGSIINAVASYDNTADNPNNPSSPPRFVTWGEATTDEMYYLPIGFVDYQPGDEDIIFSEGPVLSVDDLQAEQHQLFPITPNPVSDHALAGFRLQKGQVVSIEIVDMQGQKVRTLREGEFFNTGEHYVDFSTRQMSPGVYFIHVQGKDFKLSQRFVKG